jgi:acetyl-CoA/propionyl-CoA carboxylase, biotin carboxylase, biotin carboxyl carrier protein
MRIVRTADEYAAAAAAAAREARGAFGDDTLLIEKYVESGRHLEVQVIGDTHGEVVHLFERDCSTQRRHQKVLEEAPGPTVDADLRHRLTGAAVALAREVGYTNAGTVEFLLDADTGDFYFLEMNTRLQVEHPVTELVCGGIDLVEEQLRVAAGAPLSLRQEDLALHGHAIEARVYAEDSFGGFLPQAGTATLVRWTSSARVDHALEPGQTVSTSYDPMLGKVIAHGPDRESARQALLHALDDTAILGLTTNAGFLRALVASDEFRDATIDTAWLDHHDVPAPDHDVPRVMAAWVSAMLSSADTGHPFQRDGFRLGGPPAPIVVELDRDVVVDRHLGTVDGTPVQMVSAENHVLELVVDGHTERAVVNVQPDIVEVSYRGQRHVLTGPDRLAEAETAGDGTVVAPMPGTVLEVRVAAGDRVADGDVLGMMEAMKMELSLKAPFAGTLASVDAAAGAQVALGATLFVVSPDDVPAP